MQSWQWCQCNLAAIVRSSMPVISSAWAHNTLCRVRFMCDARAWCILRCKMHPDIRCRVLLPTWNYTHWAAYSYKMGRLKLNWSENHGTLKIWHTHYPKSTSIGRCILCACQQIPFLNLFVTKCPPIFTTLNLMSSYHFCKIIQFWCLFVCFFFCKSQ